MTPLKKKIIDEIMKTEGGFVNDPSDSGGATKYGITETVARQVGWMGKMQDLPYQFAFDVYAHLYWDALQLDDIEQRSPEVAAELADTSVNLGTMRAGTFFQRCLNALNNEAKDYPDMIVDGRVRVGTVRAFNKFMDRRGTVGSIIMCRALNSLQGAFYIELAERRQKDEKFLAGWLLNRVK